MIWYACTIFLSAFLLFALQPLMGKYILPWFGGGPGVWPVCLLFFSVYPARWLLLFSLAEQQAQYEDAVAAPYGLACHFSPLATDLARFELETCG